MEYRHGKPGEPWAVQSAFGWAVIGPRPKRVVSTLSACQSSILQSNEKDLKEQTRKWFDNESYCSRVKLDDRLMSDVKLLEILQKTTACEDSRSTVAML